MEAWNACRDEPSAILKWIECHPGTAGWIQGVGTLVAIAIAVLIPLLLRRREELYQKRQYARFLASALQRLALSAFVLRRYLYYNPEIDTEPQPEHLGSAIRGKLLDFIASARVVNAVTFERLESLKAAVGILNVQEWLMESLPPAEKYARLLGTAEDEAMLLEAARSELGSLPPIGLPCAATIEALGFDYRKSHEM